MEIVEFPEQNTVYAENQSQYKRLYAHRVEGDLEGMIICCWSLTWRERLRLLLTGRVWHEILTFGHPLQPQRLTTHKPSMPAPPNEI